MTCEHSMLQVHQDAYLVSNRLITIASRFTTDYGATHRLKP